jgi:hypothetical protein
VLAAGKSRVSDLVWDRFGEVRNYCEPFAGSLAVLLNRPTAPGIETVNDLDCVNYRAPKGGGFSLDDIMASLMLPA